MGCTSKLIRALNHRAFRLALLLSLVPLPLQAEGPNDEATRLTPPEAIDVSVSYPEDATGSATVTLELIVDAEGRVHEARTVSGEPPFSEVAQTAALEWRFEPAIRSGIRVAARIRFSVRFVPPESEQDEPPPKLVEPSTSDPQTVESPTTRPPTPIEVVVKGERRPPGAVIVTREEARALPGAFGDPLRAIEAMPGVVPIVSGLPAFFIRGAPPANVGFFVDGVDLPLLYHAFLGPSVIHPAFIGGIEFYPGSAPVQYGRFAGPVIAVSSSPFKGAFSGEAALRAIDVGAFVQGPLGGCDPLRPQCRKSNARIAGRYSYTGLVLSLLSDAKLSYWDYSGSVEHPIGPNDTLSVFAFGAYDYFRAPQEAENSGGELTFHRMDLRWDRRLGRRTDLRVAVTGGYDRAAGAIEDSSVVTDHSLRGRIELEHEASSSATLYAGVDARGDRYGLDTNPRYLSYPDYSTLFPERTDLVVGAYASAELLAARGVRIAPGIRADVYRSQGTTKIGVDPRISAEFQVNPTLRFEHSFGFAHQRPNFAAQVPGAQVADLQGGLQWALLWSSGVRLALPADFSASATVFRTAYFRALDPIGGARDFTIDRTVIERRSTVSGGGLELQISRAMTRRLGGFVSYTLSRSEQSTPTQKSVSGFDRPHVLQAALGYDLGRGVRVAGRGVFYSGIPELNLQGSPHFTSKRRGPPYFRVDARAEKRWRINESNYWALVFEVLNATSTQEVIRLDCGEICRERAAGPVILPSVAIEAGF